MISTEILTIKENGKLTLPDEIVERYQFKKETQFRIIETQKGILIIPLTNEPVSDELKSELEEWQTIGADSWEMFGFEENAP
jgi:bifunctional DNA-binding transcriptional regulator/antitoxin component of YhaV-PrlF toxin-antitoxin module